tara:strand:- start:1832 stop:2245 length:414 start_codon:yes stop_codon:yes gene_type:complete
MRYIVILLVVLFTSCSETLCTFVADDDLEYKVLYDKDGVTGRWDIVVIRNRWWESEVMVGKNLPIFDYREVSYDTYGVYAQDTIIKRWSQVQLEPDEIISYLKAETNLSIGSRIRYERYAIKNAIEEREFIDKLKCE